MSAAVKVIGQQGYHNAPISKIAREAGVADGTVYLYFKNKEDLLISILRDTIGRIVDRIDEAYNKDAQPEKALQNLVTIYFETLGSNQNLALVTQIHLRQADADLRRQIGDIIRPYYRLIDRIIEDGVRIGVFRAEMDRRIARRVVFGTMDETITAWILTGAKYNLLSVIPAVVDMLLSGMRVRNPA